MQVHTVNKNGQTSNCHFLPVFKQISSYLDFLHIQVACCPN